jgi:large subunit ribosomal protein L7/L12
VSSKINSADLLGAFKEMTVLELAQFVETFEKTFGVTAVAPVTSPAPGGIAPAEPEQDEPTEFDVALTAVGDKKVQVIKEVRALTRLGLKEAKDFVEDTPKTVLEGVGKDAAEQARAALVKAGATVTVRATATGE